MRKRASEKIENILLQAGINGNFSNKPHPTGIKRIMMRRRDLIQIQTTQQGWQVLLTKLFRMYIFPFYGGGRALLPSVPLRQYLRGRVGAPDQYHIDKEEDYPIYGRSSPGLLLQPLLVIPPTIGVVAAHDHF